MFWEVATYSSAKVERYLKNSTEVSRAGSYFYIPSITLPSPKSELTPRQGVEA